MPTEEDQHQVETEQDSTLEVERESEDSTELDDLFSEEESTEDAPVTREEYNRLLKGVKKLASERGRDKKEIKTEKEDDVVTSNTNPVLKSLYFKANPEAESVWKEVEKEAKNLGKDPFELYESSTYLKNEAKAKFSEKTETEENVTRISRPNQGSAGGNRGFAGIDLSNKSDIAWLNAKDGRRQEYMDWYATHK